MSTFETVSVRELANLMSNQPLQLIDVRTPAEFQSVHAASAKNFPLDQLDTKKLAKHFDTDQPLYVICRSGNRSATACQNVAKAGWTNAVNVEGGTTAWVNAGLPVHRGTPAIPSGKRLQVAAGLIVLTVSSAVLFTGNHYLAIVPALIGAVSTIAATGIFNHSSSANINQLPAKNGIR